MFLLPKKEFEVSFKGTPLEKYMDFFDLSGELLIYFDLDNNALLLKETAKVEREIRFRHNNDLKLIRIADIASQPIDIGQTISYYFPSLYSTTIKLPPQPSQASLTYVAIQETFAQDLSI